ncbi:hypothetical protein NDU88_001461 [Pleurodeles waltl]|uniref:Uncharacterized protein n=1 Tax=Pleurodeles waltl TaxID=8319 RepID=A0AAV7MJT2_PLEWA|nr:hypothetical protein NDU88_001461 [Pleurodeles waltl]
MPGPYQELQAQAVPVSASSTAPGAAGRQGPSGKPVAPALPVRVRNRADPSERLLGCVLLLPTGPKRRPSVGGIPGSCSPYELCVDQDCLLSPLGNSSRTAQMATAEAPDTKLTLVTFREYTGSISYSFMAGHCRQRRKMMECDRLFGIPSHAPHQTLCLALLVDFVYRKLEAKW